MNRITLLLMLAASAAILTTCDSGLTTALEAKVSRDDPIDPALSNGDQVTIGAQDYQSLEVSWNAATDPRRPDAVLEYRLVFGGSRAEVTGDAANTAAVALDWTQNTFTGTLDGLEPGTEYWANVVVRDPAGNETLYLPDHKFTLEDTVGPTFDVAPAMDSRTSDEIVVSWSASDALTAPQDLSFRILVDCASALDPRSGDVSQDWIAGISSHAVTELVDDVSYTITVQARDGSGNISASGLTESTLKYPRLFWTEAGVDEVFRSETSGANSAPLNETGLSNPLGIAVDPVERRIYFVDSTTNTIRSNNFAGTDPQLEIDGLNFPLGIAVDHTAPNRYLYWTDRNTNTIYRSELPPLSTDPSGYAILNEANDGVDLPYGIDVDDDTDEFYWVEQSFGLANPRIRKAPAADPTDTTTVVTNSYLNAPTDIALDHVRDRMYWTDDGDNTVCTRAYNPETIAVLIDTNLSQPYGITINAAETVAEVSFYFVDSTENRLYRYDLGDPPASTDALDIDILSSLSIPRGIDVY